MGCVAAVNMIECRLCSVEVSARVLKEGAILGSCESSKDGKNMLKTALKVSKAKPFQPTVSQRSPSVTSGP